MTPVLITLGILFAIGLVAWFLGRGTSDSFRPLPIEPRAFEGSPYRKPGVPAPVKAKATPPPIPKNVRRESRPADTTYRGPHPSDGHHDTTSVLFMATAFDSSPSSYDSSSSSCDSGSSDSGGGGDCGGGGGGD